MKTLRWFVFAVMLSLVAAGYLEARLVRIWTEQELYTKSDLVVMATPTATHDTQERLEHFLGFDRQKAIGVATDFTVSAVLKGDRMKKEVVLHHYRPDGMRVPNAPSFISFDPVKKQGFHLYLTREADDRYAPVAGQEEPGQSVRRVTKE